MPVDRRRSPFVEVPPASKDPTVLFVMPSTGFGGQCNTDVKVTVAVHLHKDFGRSFVFTFWNGMGVFGKDGGKETVVWAAHWAFSVRCAGLTNEHKPFYEATIYEGAPGESDCMRDRDDRYGELLGNKNMGPLAVLVFGLRKYRSNLIHRLGDKQQIMEHSQTALYVIRSEILCGIVDEYTAEGFNAELRRLARKRKSEKYQF